MTSVSRPLCGAFAVLLAVVLLVAACASPEEEAAPLNLTPVPWPDLSAADTAVQEQVAAQRAQAEALVAAARTPPERQAAAQAVAEAGLLLMTYEFMDAAGGCFAQAVALAPDDFRWTYLEGYLHGMLGRSDLSAEQLRRAHALAPHDLPVRVRLAEAELAVGRPDEARRLFEGAVKEAPELARAWAGLGQLALDAGDDAGAAELYGRALKLEPAANSLHYTLSQIYRRLGDPERASFHLARRGDIQVPLADPLLDRVSAMGRSESFFMTQASQAMNNQRYDIAAESYRKALELAPGSYGASRGLAFSLAQLGDPEGARRVLERALASGSRNEPGDADQRADIHRRLGESFVLEGQDEPAIRAFEAGLEESPQRADLRQLLGNALAREERFQEAVAQYDFVLRGLPQSAPTRARRGAAKLRLGDVDGALADLRQAAADAPEDDAIRQQLAVALRSVGRAGEADRVAAQAGPAGAGDLEPARTALARGDFRAAEESLAQILEKSPDHPEALLLHASTLGQLGRFDASAERFRAVLRTDPRNQQAWFGELTALLLAERFSEARERMREALELYPRDAALAHALARLLVSSPVPGDRNGALALQMIERVLAFAPGGEARQTYAMALAEMGRFDDAVAAQRAASQGAGGQAEDRLRSYEAGSPWVARSPTEVVEVLHAARPGQR